MTSTCIDGPCISGKLISPAIPETKDASLSHYRLPKAEAVKAQVLNWLPLSNGYASRRVLRLCQVASDKINRSLAPELGITAFPLYGGNTTDGWCGATPVVISDRYLALSLTGMGKGTLCRVEDLPAIHAAVEKTAQALGMIPVRGTHMVRMATMTGAGLYAVGGGCRLIVDSDHCERVDGKDFVNLAIVLRTKTGTKFSTTAAKIIGRELAAAVSGGIPELTELSSLLKRCSSNATVELGAGRQRAAETDAREKAGFDAIKSNFVSRCRALGIAAQPETIYPNLTYRSPGTPPRAQAQISCPGTIFSPETTRDVKKLNDEVSALSSEVAAIFKRNGVAVSVGMDFELAMTDQERFLLDHEGGSEQYPLASREDWVSFTLLFNPVSVLDSLRPEQIQDISRSLKAITARHAG